MDNDPVQSKPEVQISPRVEERLARCPKCKKKRLRVRRRGDVEVQECLGASCTYLQAWTKERLA